MDHIIHVRSSHGKLVLITSGSMEVDVCVKSQMVELEWNVQDKGMTCRAFHVTGQRLCREVHSQV
jgi:predicted NUDIX family NTP pyrophosphohydrolase